MKRSNFISILLSSLQVVLLLLLIHQPRASAAFTVGRPTTRPSITTTSKSSKRFALFKNNDQQDNTPQDVLKQGYQTLNQGYQTLNEIIGRRKDMHVLESRTFVVTPLVAGIVSFFLYPTTSIWFHNTVNYFSNNNWEPVDGGNLQWSILLPALNGVVMTAISLLYANLISVTGTQLRNRQITVHSTLSREVQGLRELVQLVAYYPTTDDSRQYFASCIQQYLQVLVQETDPEQQQNLQDLRSNSFALSQYRNGLHSFSTTDTNTMIQGTILERSYETLQRICDARTTRITSLQTKFPQLHYVTITALTIVILFVFLLETDRKVILFLDKFQIRSVWALLVGTVTAIYCIGIDLAQPFIGTYTVPADQLLQDQEELLDILQSITTGSSSNRMDSMYGGQEQPSEGFSDDYSYDTYNNNNNNNNNDFVNGGDTSMSLYEEYMRSRGNAN